MRPRAEISADRRFARQICAGFGLIFITLGYSAAFTDVGAWLVFASFGMMTSAALLWTRLPSVVGALAAPLITVTLLVLLWLDRRA